MYRLIYDIRIADTSIYIQNKNYKICHNLSQNEIFMINIYRGVKSALKKCLKTTTRIYTVDDSQYCIFLDFIVLGVLKK